MLLLLLLLLFTNKPSNNEDIGILLLLLLFILVTDDLFKLDKNLNIFIPIVENYIGSNATRPSTVVKTLNGHTVEITDTDAEGRLCIADCLE